MDNPTLTADDSVPIQVATTLGIPPGAHTAEEVRARLANFGKYDPETADTVMDTIVKTVLRAISEGRGDARHLANYALTVMSAQYSR